MRSSRLALATLSLVLTAACASTVQVRSTGSGLEPGGTSSVGLPGQASPDGTTSEAGLPPAGSDPAARGSAGGAVAQPGTAVSSGPKAGTPVRGRGRVSSIRVGVIYLKGLEAAYQAAGASNSTADSRASYEAVFRYLNAHGGAGGVKLVPSYFAVDASSTQSQATQVEAACAAFSDDTRVDIVLTYTKGSGLARCLERKGIPLVNGFGGAGSNEATFTSNRLYWEPSQLSLDALGRLLADFLVDHHYVDGRWPSVASCASVTEPRIGVVTFDRPEWRDAYHQSLAPAFKAKGHPIYDVVFISVSGSTAQQLSQASSGAQSAVLKFASECVDHVVFMSNVALDYLFMNIADQQQYRPRYGLSSLEAPPIIIPNLANPTSQLHGALGPGWSPYADVAIADFDALAKAPSALCVKMLSAANAAPRDNNAATLALPSCEGPLFTAAVVARWASSPPGTTMLDVVNSLGSSYRPAGTYTSSVSAQRHYGAKSYRAFSYVDACTCFRYGSGLRPI